jgi:hypothetical protein
VSRVDALNSVKFFSSGSILGCNHNFCVFNKSIKVIRNPLIISDTNHTRHNWCQKWDGLIELLDLRLNCIVTAVFYENGDATNVSTPAG